MDLRVSQQLAGGRGVSRIIPAVSMRKFGLAAMENIEKSRCAKSCEPKYILNEGNRGNQRGRQQRQQRTLSYCPSILFAYCFILGFCLLESNNVCVNDCRVCNLLISRFLSCSFIQPTKSSKESNPRYRHVWGPSCRVDARLPCIMLRMAQGSSSATWPPCIAHGKKRPLCPSWF